MLNPTYTTATHYDENETILLSKPPTPLSSPSKEGGMSREWYGLDNTPITNPNDINTLQTFPNHPTGSQTGSSTIPPVSSFTTKPLVLSLQSMLDAPLAPAIVDRMFVRGSIISFVGSGNTYKTFLALDLALSIAAGLPTWQGKALHTKGKVLYIVGEGRGRFKTRLLAWLAKHPDAADAINQNFFWTNGPVVMVGEKVSKEFKQLHLWVKQEQPVLVVVDSLARSFGGGADEDKNIWMGQFVRSLDALRDAGGDLMTILVIHHTTKGKDVDRGGGAFRNAIETQVHFKVKKTAVTPQVVISCDRQRDFEYFPPMVFVVQEVILEGELEPTTGDPVISVVLVVSDEADTKEVESPTSKVSKEEAKVRRLLAKEPDMSANRIHKFLKGTRADNLKLIARIKVEMGILTPEIESITPGIVSA